MKRAGGSALALALLSQLAQSAAGVVGFLIVARIFGPIVFADYVFGIAVAGIFGCFTQNALREPVILSQEHGREFFHFASFVISSASALICGVAGFALQIYLPGRHVGHIVIALAVKAFIDGFVVVPYAVRARERDFLLPAVASISASLGSIALLFILVKYGATILSLPIAQALGSLVALCVYAVVDREALLLRPGALKHPIPAYVKNWFRISLWQLIEYANSMFDRLYSGRTMPQVDQGMYGFSRRLNDLFFEVLGGTVASLSLPLLASAATDRGALRLKYFELLQVVGVVLLGAIGALYCLSGRLLVDVFGSKWVGAVPLYRIFLLLGVIQAYGYLQASLIRGVGNNALWTRYVTAQAISNVIVVVAFASYGAFVLSALVVAKTYLIWMVHIKSVAKIIECSVAEYLKILVKPLAVVMLPVLSCELLHWKLPASSNLMFYFSTSTLYVICWCMSVMLICPQTMVFVRKLFGRRHAIQ